MVSKATGELRLLRNPGNSRFQALSRDERGIPHTITFPHILLSSRHTQSSSTLSDNGKKRKKTRQSQDRFDGFDRFDAFTEESRHEIEKLLYVGTGSGLGSLRNK